MTAGTQVQAESASPGQIDSHSKHESDTEDLLAAGRSLRALGMQSVERSRAVCAEYAAWKEQNERRRQGLPAGTGKPSHTQPVLSPATQSHATPAAGPWPPTAGSSPACRIAAAEAFAAAAMAWAASAVGLEAKAEASAARTVSLPAAERTHVAVEWQAAAAAWRAAFEQLEYARQADPEAAVVQQSEQSICDMRGFKRQCQQW